MITLTLQRKKLKLREVAYGKQTQMYIPLFCSFLPKRLYSQCSAPWFSSIMTLCRDFSPSIHRNLNYTISIWLSFPSCERMKDNISSQSLSNSSHLYLSEESETGWTGRAEFPPSQVPGPRLLSFTSQPWVLKLHSAALSARDKIRFHATCPL